MIEDYNEYFLEEARDRCYAETKNEMVRWLRIIQDRFTKQYKEWFRNRQEIMLIELEEHLSKYSFQGSICELQL